MKSKNKPLYLLNRDIEQLNERYKELYKQVKNAFENNDIDKNQIEYSCEVLLDKYKFEIEELSDMREIEYLTRQAELEAKRKNITPWRRGWWWRLIFQPLTNRAQDIIEERAELEAEELFSSEESKLKERAAEIYGKNSDKLSERKRKKALKKYLKYKRLLEGELDGPQKPVKLELNQQPEHKDPAEPVKLELKQPEPPEPPARKPRKTKKTEG